MGDPHNAKNLCYGTPGTALYNPDLQEWTFLRHLGRPDHKHEARIFPPGPGVKGPTRIIPPISYPDFPETKSLSKSSKSLKRALPEIASLPLDIQNGQRLTTGFELLAFGNAVLIGRDDSTWNIRLVPVIAFAYGDAGEALKIIALDGAPSKLRTKDTNHENDEPPDIATQSGISRMGAGSPILQIRSADTKTGNGIWIAVRFATSTVFCAPIVSHFPTGKRATRLDDGCSLVHLHEISANALVDIPISRTGGYSHADIDFNPENENQAAIVDTRGTWSVWQLRDPFHRPALTLERIELKAFGKLGTAECQNDTSYISSWYSIRWIHSDSTSATRILITGRRSAGLFDIRGRFLSMVDLDLGPWSEKQLVLDVQRNSGDAGQCFVLTTTKLLWLSSHIPPLRDSRRPKELEIVLSWRHFLVEDASLYLNTLNTVSATSVFVSSLANPLTILFQFTNTKVSQSDLSSAGPKPILLRSPGRTPGRNIQGHDGKSDLPAKIYFRPIQGGSQANSPALKNLSFLKMFIQCVDLSIYEQTFEKMEASLFDENHSLTCRKPSSNTRHVLEEGLTGLAESREFLVGHNNNSVYEGAAVLDRLAYFTYDENAIRQARKKWRIHHEDIYTIAAGIGPHGAALEQANFNEYLDNIMVRFLSSQRFPGHGATLVKELASHSPQLSEVEKGSRKLDRLLLKIRQMAQTVRLRTSSTNHSQDFSSITQIYDTLIRLFLTNLPADTSYRLRASKERVCRNVAADLALSNYYLLAQYEPTEIDGVPGEVILEPGDNQSTLRPSVSLPPLPQTSQTDLKGQGATNVVEQALSRLRAFSPVEESRSNTNTRAVSDILSHIPNSPHSSPQNYSYRQAEQGIAASITAEQAAKMDPKARRKAERARQRFDKARKKAESQIAESSHKAPPAVGSSQIPHQDRSSQPDLITKTLSSQTQSIPTVGGNEEGKISVLPYVQSIQPTISEPGSSQRKRMEGASKRRAGF